MSLWSTIAEVASRIGMAIGRSIANGVLADTQPGNRQERRRHAALARRKRT